MYREAMADLIAWKNSKNRLPLIIRGARQVGKTWLMKEFGRTQYPKSAYINFDGNKRMERLFTGDLDIKRIITALQLEAGCTIEPENTLIIFDEVQEVPRALTSLKYFCENAPEYHLVAAGSLLGVALHPGTSFPVGKVSFLDLYPLSFAEFMRACGGEGFLELIRKQDWELVSSFKDKYLEFLKQYYFIGGMPEVVASFSKERDYSEARAIQKRILMAYEQDFSKHAPNETVPRIRMLWNSIPSQLAKENKKFIYGLIRKGARAREYELAMTWLIDCGLVHKVNRVKKPSLPLRAYEDFGAFKLFVLDVGLLAAMCELDAITLLDGSQIFQEFRGALTEQYVRQEFACLKELSVFYWTAEGSQAEVDFVIQNQGRVLPVEVKAAENLQAKSLKVYNRKFSPQICIRTSASDYRREKWFINLPLYAISQIDKISLP